MTAKLLRARPLFSKQMLTFLKRKRAYEYAGHLATPLEKTDNFNYAIIIDIIVRCKLSTIVPPHFYANFQMF